MTDRVAAGTPRALSSIAVLAEETQGALSAASRLQQRGLSVEIVRSPDDLMHGQVPDALIVDLGIQRGLEDPRAVVEQWTRRLRALGVPHIEARVDPALHGSPSELVKGVLAASSEDAMLWAVLAYPTAGRAVIDGQLVFTEAGGVLVDLDVAQTLGLVDAARISLDTVTAGADQIVEAVNQQRRAGARSFVFDATTEVHLDVIAQAAEQARSSGLPLVSATSGAWLRQFPDTGGDGFVLVGAAGLTTVDGLQLARVADTYGSDAVVLDSDQAMKTSLDRLGLLLARHRVVVVQARASDHLDPIIVANDIAAAVGQVLNAAVSNARPCLGIIASGGLTTSAIFDELNATAIIPGNELEPLCPVVRLVGGPHDRLAVISKSGSVGTAETLVRLIRRVIGS